jgi:hypothetical protein
VLATTDTLERNDPEIEADTMGEGVKPGLHEHDSLAKTVADIGETELTPELLTEGEEEAL